MIVRESLPNGLTVILVPIEGSKTICEMFAVRAGWKYEWPEVYGISHFIEHMMFRGTEKRPTEEKISEEVEGRGGAINAGTMDEYTVYWVHLPGRFIDLAHELLSDMVLNSRFDPEAIEIEKGPVQEELAGVWDDTVGYLQDILWLRLLYGDQPVSQIGTGTEETISSFRREQLLDYIGEMYTALNSAVIVAGQIEDHKKVIKNLGKHYGSLRSGRPAILKPAVVEKQHRPRISFKHRKIKQTHVMLGVRAYDIFHPDRYALKVLEAILGGGMSSRMFLEVRSKRGLAYLISSGSEFQTDAGWFITYAAVNSKKIVEAIEVMMREYQKAREERVSEAELKKAKDFIVGSQEMALDDSKHLADFVAEQFLLEDRIETPEERASKIRAVTAEDVQRVARDIFQNKKLNLALIGPHQRRNLQNKIYPILKF